MLLLGIRGYGWRIGRAWSLQEHPDRHMPFGTILDAFLSTQDSVTGYPRCGDSATWTGRYLAALPETSPRNWGVTSNFGPKRNGRQFDGWCHDPNCTLFNSRECTEQVSTQDVTR